MKDLKHLIYFENLLQEAQNELVSQAVNDGKIALGYNCYYIPEVLLNLPGCFSSRLRAPRCSSPDVATYYMTNRNCPYVRSILERGIEGGYNYLSALFGAESCAAMERMQEHFFLINPVKNDKFFVTIIDPPMKGDKTSLDYYKAQLKLKVVDELEKRFGIDVSDAAMRKAVEDFNELCDVITEIGSFPSRERIEIAPGESAFDAICRHYLHWNQCARFMSGDKIDQRHLEVKRLVDEFHADGVVYENMKFCEFWSYEKVLGSFVLQNEMGVPCCTIEKEYALGSVGQLRTRFQAFVESLEIKKINA